MSKYKNPKYIKRIGLRLKDIRKDRGVTQKELSRVSGLAVSQIGRIERGEISTSLDHLKTLADNLKISMTDLFDL